MDPFENLVVTAQLGDTEAFSTLVEKHYSMVHGLALSRIRRWDAAEDVTQEVFLLAWTHLHSLMQPRAFSVWLRRIARNCASAWLMDEGYRRKVSAQLTEEHPGSDREGPDPVAAAARQECLDSIDRDLDGLSPKLREAVILYYFEGKTAPECAQALGVNVETMKKRLQAGRNELRRRYGQPEAPDLDQLLPYSPRHYARQVMAGLAAGPAVPGFTHGVAPRPLALCLHHLRHGGSMSMLRQTGLIPASAKWAVAGLVAALTVVGGGAGLVASRSMHSNADPAGLQGPETANTSAYYEGTGIVNTPHWDDPVLGNYVCVERVLPGYPCDRAGLRSGDRIIQVDGQPLNKEYWTGHRLNGPAGTQVTVTVLRKLEDGSEQQIDLAITRDFIPRTVYNAALEEFRAEQTRQASLDDAH